MRIMSEKYSISPFHLFVIYYVNLVGIGVLTFQHNLIFPNGSQNDAWVSIIAASLVIALVTKMMYVVLSRQQETKANLVHINRRYLGRYLGMVANWIFIVYFILGAFGSFHSYIQVLQLWVFPNMTIWPIALVIIGLIYYAVSGGFQSVTAICFWGTLFTVIFIFPQEFFIAPYLHPNNLMPVFTHNLQQYFSSAREFSHELLSCLVLLVVYPFIQQPKKSQKWAYIAVASSTLIYLLMFFLSYMYFSPGQLQITLWPTPTFVSMIELPLMQRMEYLILTLWLLKVLAAISVGVWASCQCIKLVHGIRPSRFLILILILFFICFHFKTPASMPSIVDIYDHMGEMLVFLYIPLLFVVALVVKNAGRTELTS